MLKQHGKQIDQELESQVNAALIAAGELEGWQRWSADKLREELLAKAQGLLTRPEGQELGGRKAARQPAPAARRLEKGRPERQRTAPRAVEEVRQAYNAAYKHVEVWLAGVNEEGDTASTAPSRRW